MKQRQLTQEEIDLAPEWATDYFVDDGYLIWDSEYIQSVNNSGAYATVKSCDLFGVCDDAQPIPRKVFYIASIESPNMHDMDHPYIRGNDDGTITVDGKIDKYLVIAIAKALGVTAPDFIDTKPDNAIIDNNETK